MLVISPCIWYNRCERGEGPIRDNVINVIISLEGPERRETGMKLTVIGGAGARSPMLLKSLAAEADSLGLTRLVFLDDDTVRRQAFGPLLMEAARRLRPGMDFSVTGDERAALWGADYVITTIRAGADQSRVTDERVALGHGVIGQETTGAGGFAMALRSIPALTRYCALAKELAAPGFMMFNFTNPAGLVTQALRDLGYDFVYGICDAPTGLLRQVARLLNRRPEEFEADLIGLNHLSYFTSLRLDGREVLPQLLENPRLYAETDMRYFHPALAQHLGCLLNEYLYYYYYRERAEALMLSARETRGERIASLNRQMVEELLIMDAERDFDGMLRLYGEITLRREADYMASESGVQRDEASTPRFDLYAPEVGGYAGVALKIIRARITGAPGEMSACVPNRGTIPWLLDGDVIEVMCRLGKEGPVPKALAHDLPEGAKTLIRTVKYYERTAARAIVQKDWAMARDALAAHPLVNSYSLAEMLLDEYLKAYESYTGAWNK
jgi:6-phospho-beta-glucosidase